MKMRIAAFALIALFVAASAFAQADLALAKSVSNATPNVGDTITFTVTLTNNGPNSATGVSVQDLLPAGLTFVSANPSQGSYTNSTGAWAVGTVNTGTPQTLTIHALVATPSPQTNTATISASGVSDPEPANNTASATETPQQADLSVSKMVSSPTPNVGDIITYTITLTNSGPSTATNVTVQDTLPAQVSFVSATPPGSYDGVTGVWTVGTVASGAQATLVITVQVNSPNPSGNTASILHSDQFDPNTANNSDTTSTNPANANLSLTKTVGNATPNVGSNVTFTVTLTNSGPATATSLAVTDVLPAGLTFVSSNPSQGSYAGGVWTAGTLAAGAVATLPITATVVSANAQTNTATITHSDQTDSNTGNNTASATETPQSADLAVTKTASTGTPLSGANFTWTVTVTNNGPDAATNVTVADALPAGVSIVNANPSQGTYAAGVWTIGSIASGGASVTLVLTVTAGPAGPVTNTAAVSHSDQFDPNTANNLASSTVTISALSADLGLTKAVDNSTPNVGTNVNFTVTLHNAGPNGATGITVTDILPAGLTFVTATPSQGTYNSATGAWSVGNVANGNSATLGIQATVVSSAAQTNVASITAVNEPDPNAANNTASVTETPQKADLSVTKTPSTPAPASGANFTWTVTVTNNGPNAATNVTVGDAIPAGVTFVSATTSQGTYAAGVWTIGSISSGLNATLALTVTAGAPAPVTNTANVTHADQFDPNPANNIASSLVIIGGPNPADLGLTKTVDNASPNVGTNVNFTVTLHNSGPNGATSVAVTDVLPSGLTFVSATPSQGTYNSGTGVWTVGSVANGASATLGIQATVTGAAAQTNTAAITGATEPDLNPVNNTASATVTPQSADLAVTKTSSTTAPASGANFTWTVTVTNNGPNAATSATVSDAIPAGVTLVSATPSQGTYAAGVWTIGSLASGTSVTLALNVTAGAQATVTNTASVLHSDQFDPNATNNSASSAVTIGASVPALSPLLLVMLALTLMAFGVMRLRP